MCRLTLLCDRAPSLSRTVFRVNFLISIYILQSPSLSSSRLNIFLRRFEYSSHILCVCCVLRMLLAGIMKCSKAKIKLICDRSFVHFECASECHTIGFE